MSFVLGGDGVGRNLNSSGLLAVASYVWDTGTLSWVKSTGSGGGGGGSVTVSNFPATQDVLVQNSLVPVAYDTIQYTNTSSTVDTYTYKTGGTGGTLVATVTLTYTDSSKATISSVVST